jgi:hypothetical protein
MGRFIDEHRGEYVVAPICAMVPITPSAYYEQKARSAHPERRPKRALRDEVLQAEVDRTWRENFQV